MNRTNGVYYTSDSIILKTIKPLFLDELWNEFNTIHTIEEFKTFHNKLSSLTFFDPSCGCGNFFLIIYEELVKLENTGIKKFYKETIPSQILL